MGLFSCDYLETHGGFFSAEYVCKLTMQKIESTTANNVCNTSNYTSCYNYKKKSSFWFIANAAYQALEMDGSPELEDFLDWKCCFICNSDKGAEFLKEYMEKAPLIVERIGKGDNPRSRYEMLYKAYLSPCIELIHNKDYDQALHIYMEMYNVLKHEYLDERMIEEKGGDQ